MFKFICLVAISAVASAQWWPQPTTRAPWQNPSRPQPPAWQPDTPSIPNWPVWPQNPDQPQLPQWPDHNIPQLPQQPLPPQWNPQPEQPRPRPPILNDEVGRPGVRDTRCNNQTNRQTSVFPHDRHCNLFHQCSNGLRFTFECPPPLLFDRRTLACTPAAGARC